MANGASGGGGGLLLGGLISGGLGLAKSIFGGIQAAKGQKAFKKTLANRPKYNIPEEYMKSLGIYQNLAAGEMPGMDMYQQQIGESTARAMTGAERGAISSNVYQGAVESAQDKELKALQDLALMGVQYKTQSMQNLAGAQTQMGQLKDVQFEYNQNQPWQMQMNMANEQRQAGMQNLFGGLGEMGSTVQNFVGTKYYTDMLKGLQESPYTPIPQSNYQMPTNYSPTQNLSNTASELLKRIQYNYPKK